MDGSNRLLAVTIAFIVVFSVVATGSVLAHSGTTEEISTEAIPEHAESVAHYSGSLITDNQTKKIESAMDTSVREYVNDIFFDKSELMLSQINGATTFEVQNGNTAIVITSSWDKSVVIPALKHTFDGTYGQEEYNGQEVYMLQSGVGIESMAVLDNGIYVVGDKKAVKQSVTAYTDNSTDPTDKVDYITESESLYSTVDSNAYERIDMIPFISPADVDTDRIDTVRESYKTEDDSINYLVTLETESDTDATSIKDQLTETLSDYQNDIDDDKVNTVLDEVSISSEENVVYVEYENNISNTKELIQWEQNDPPINFDEDEAQASVTFDEDSTEDVVKIQLNSIQYAEHVYITSDSDRLEVTNGFSSSGDYTDGPTGENYLVTGDKGGVGETLTVDTSDVETGETAVIKAVGVINGEETVLQTYQVE